MNPIDLERQLAFNATPTSRKAERKQLAQDVDSYCAAGGKIQHIPFGMSAVNRDDFRHLYHPHEVTK